MSKKVENSKGGQITTSKSLLDSPYEETQVKDKPHKVAWRVFIVSFLLVLLIVSYIFKFSIDIYPTEIGKYYISSFETDNFYKMNACDLLVIKTTKELQDVQVGDIIFYSTNTEKGSGKVVSIENDIVELEQTDGNLRRVGERFVKGIQVDKIPIIGFILAFLDSYFGIIILTALFLSYTAYITFSRINYENTLQGRKLYKRYIKTKEEEKEKRELLAKLKGNEDIELKISNMLNGPYKENASKFKEFDCETKGSVKEKYKYVLSEIHETYLPKTDLTKNEKRQITAIIELMFDAEGFDADMEYMLVDLSLKTNLQDFDIQDFRNNAINFIKNCEHRTYLLNLSSVLYVIAYKNNRVRNEFFAEIVSSLGKKLEEFDSNEQNSTKYIADSILNLIKT